MWKLHYGVMGIALACLTAFAQDDRGLGAAVAAGAHEGGRVALVIGNGAYSDAPLRNPVNDAADVAATLKRLGFAVTLATDAGHEAMEKAVAAFGREIRGADAALFYYAGHGFQVEGQNYLIPVDAVVEAENEVKFRCLDAGLVLAKMEAAGARVNLVVLDACRNNPFARSFRSAAKGLGVMNAASGTLVAFSTSPGNVAADGTGRNSFYTASLLKHIETPGLSASQLFMRVRNDVLQETGKKQTPWENTSLTGDFYFAKAYTIQPETAAPPVVVKPAPAAVPDVGLLQVNVNVAGARVTVDGEDRGTAGPGAPLNLQGLPVKTVTVSVSAEGYESLTQQVALPRGQWQQVVFQLAPVAVAPPPPPPAPVAAVPAGGAARAGEARVFEGIEMVWCPPGTFTMGSPRSEANRDDDETQHQVTLTQGFWLGKYEVTQEQWERVMGSNPSNFRGAKNPVEQVSWNDVQSFCQKLGNGFRLPTEAEWEYACRAGSKAAYCFGDSESGLGDYAWYGGNSGSATHPVGGKKPNAWGLYDMHGNVWEWCQDWYGDYPGGSMTDPRGSSSGSNRVDRGGSWDYHPGRCRSADRAGGSPEGRSYDLGFRPALPAVQ